MMGTFGFEGASMGGVGSTAYVLNNDGGAGGIGGLGGMQAVAMGAPPPAYLVGTAYTQQGHTTPSGEEVRTVFVTGFPADVRERELHNLVRYLPGYEASQMSFKPGQQPQGFVLFATATHARQACDAIAGTPFEVIHHSSNAAAQSNLGGNNTSGTNLGHESSGNMSNANGAGSGGSENTTPANSGALPKQAISARNSGLAPAGADNDGSQDGTSNSNNNPNNPTLAFLRGGQNNTGIQRPGSGVGSSTTTLSGAGSQQPLRSTLSDVAQHMSGMAPFVLTPAVPPTVIKLRAEMAHKNMYLKDGDPSIRKPHRPIVLMSNPGGGGNAGNAAVYAPAANATYYTELPMYTTAGGAVGGARMNNAGNANNAIAASQNVVGNAAGSMLGGGGAAAPQVVPLGQPLGFLPVTNRGDNPPCNTLFIGNLSDQVSEIELLHLFASQPGYQQMKLVRGPRQVSCFVAFEDTLSATTVHDSLQGAVLASSDRGGMRIQYSKNPFGRRSSNPGGASTALRAGSVGRGPAGQLQNLGIGGGLDAGGAGGIAGAAFMPASVAASQWPGQPMMAGGNAAAYMQAAVGAGAGGAYGY